MADPTRPFRPIARRSLRPEILDGPVENVRELERSLAHVAQVNRWLGGTRSLRRHLAPLLRRRSPLEILDVGTGNGATMREIGAWASARGAPWHMTGLELSAAVARIAVRGAGARIVRGDALRLPFRDDAFDAAACTLTLHHFDDHAAVCLLREMARVSRELVLVSDLERTLPNYLGARLLALTLWSTNRITRNDGPLSVLRSFTLDELEQVGKDAGLRDVRVRRHAPWRLVLEGRA